MHGKVELGIGNWEMGIGAAGGLAAMMKKLSQVV